MIAKMQFPKLRKILRIPLDRLLQPIDTIRVYSENQAKTGGINMKEFTFTSLTKVCLGEGAAQKVRCGMGGFVEALQRWQILLQPLLFPNAVPERVTRKSCRSAYKTEERR